MAGRTARARRAVTVLAAGAALLVTACGEAPSEAHEIDDPVTIVEVDGSDVPQLTLTAAAAQRLDITTVPAEVAPEGIAIPTAAVIVDPDGSFWVYTSPQPQVFIREQIDVAHEDGDTAYVTAGPAAGTDVVALGAAELFGAERGIGH